MVARQEKVKAGSRDTIYAKNLGDFLSHFETGEGPGDKVALIL